MAPDIKHRSPEHAQTYSTHGYVRRRCDALLAFASVSAGGPFSWAENLRVPQNSSIHSFIPLFPLYFNNRFPILYTAATFSDAWSLILLLFKSNVSDYAVLPLHSAAKIRHKTDSKFKLAEN